VDTDESALCLREWLLGGDLPTFTGYRVTHRDIYFVREKEMSVFYKGVAVGKRRLDFLVQETIMVEIKAIINLEDVHLAQAKNYCECYHFPGGLLIF
jgi:GxxExxY protein